jgi:hypothetical protein
MIKKPLIIWQKWVDPFGGDHEETAWTDYESVEQHHYHPKDDEDIAEDTDSPDHPPVPVKSTSIKVIASPMGLIPYNEHTASGKIFNFWVGHTNFDLTETIIDVIEDHDGVETLDVFTRYRFRVGIGKCFDDAEVMSSINNTLYDGLSYDESA